MIYALGAFDGFHLGHARLLRKAAERAAEAGTGWGVMTFDGHPRQLLDRDNFRLLFSPREKDLIAAYLGVPRMEKIAFTHDFAAFSPESFFRFGRCRAGTPKILSEICAARGWTLDVVPRYSFDGMTVSSTETRRAVALGEMSLAAKMLGYPFIISGAVAEGDGRGRKLGFPTANIPVSRGKIYPPEGVYSALVRTRRVAALRAQHRQQPDLRGRARDTLRGARHRRGRRFLRARAAHIHNDARPRRDKVLRERGARRADEEGRRGLPRRHERLHEEKCRNYGEIRVL